MRKFATTHVPGKRERDGPIFQKHGKVQRRQIINMRPPQTRTCGNLKQRIGPHPAAPSKRMRSHPVDHGMSESNGIFSLTFMVHPPPLPPPLL